jgi:hypothetical protein
MKANIKTYRYLANVFASHAKAWQEGKISDESIVFSFFTKIRFSDNVYKVSNLLNEIEKLIGLDLLLSIHDLYDNTKENNKFIAEHLTFVSKHV